MERLSKCKLRFGFILKRTDCKGWCCGLECKIVLFTFLILNVGEHLCVAREKTGLEKGIENRNLDFESERNLTTEKAQTVRVNVRQLHHSRRRETISWNESINNSSLPFRFHFSSSLLHLWRIKRAYNSEEEQEKLNEDHARSFRLFYFLGGVAIVIFTIIFLTTLLCFCCPSCYMAKRRRTGGGGDSLSGSGAAYQSSGSAGGQETTITAARSSSIVMAALPLQMSHEHNAHRKSHDYGQNAIPSTSQGFKYSTYPETTTAEIN